MEALARETSRGRTSPSEPHPCPTPVCAMAALTAGAPRSIVLHREPRFSRENSAMPWAAGSRDRSAPVPAVDRAARLLLALSNGRGDASLTDLAHLLRIHKSTAHNILATLARHELVDRDPATRKYRLGPALAALGRAGAGRQDLVALAGPHLIRLQRLSGETSTLHVRDGAGSVILASEESPHQLKVTAPPGHRLPPFAGAVAKVFLAFGEPPP